MRLTALALVALLTAGCGGDDAEDPLPTNRRAPRAPAADTALGDTTLMGDTVGSPGAAQRQSDAQRQGQAPGAGPRSGESAAGQTAGAPTVDGQRLYTIQVAAFTEAATAQEWTERLRRQGLPVWTSMAEPGGRTFYRVRAGAVPTVREARQLGTIISERYNWPVWVAPMTAADRPPEDAVAATRRMLDGA